MMLMMMVVGKRILMKTYNFNDIIIIILFLFIIITIILYFSSFLTMRDRVLIMIKMMSQKPL